MSIQECQTITLSSQSPAIKTSTLYAIVDSFAREGEQVQYLDFDLQFSSMIANDSKGAKISSELLQVFRCPDFQAVDLIISLLDSSKVKSGGIIVVDSIGTLQSLLLKQEKNQIDFVKSNHKAAVLLSLIEDFACRNSKALVVANIIRPRPKNGKNSQSWDMELSGGRMIKLKSDTIISASEAGKDLAKKVLNVRLTVESADDQFSERLYEGRSFSLSLSSFI